MSEVKAIVDGYEAEFEQAADGTWGGMVPDLPTILTNGLTLEKVKENMKEAIAIWIDEAGKGQQ